MSSNDVPVLGADFRVVEIEIDDSDSETRLLARRSLCGCATLPHSVLSPGPVLPRQFLPEVAGGASFTASRFGQPISSSVAESIVSSSAFRIFRISSAQTFQVAAFYHRRLIGDTPRQASRRS